MATDDTERANDRDGESVAGRMGEDLSTFTDVTTDFYRGELERAASWRARLDQTTNWAVVLVAAILTWSFSSADNPHYVLLIGVFGVLAFLVMESNRYREYDVWRDRVRTVQSEVFADVYAPDGEPTAWQERLGEDLRNPTFNVTQREALTHRLRRSYLALLLILLTAWVARITVFTSDETWQQTASIFVVPGEAIVGCLAALYLGLVVLTLWSARGSTVREFQE